MPKNIRDQVIIIEAINEVRKELRELGPDAPMIETLPVVTRLSTLYSVLDLQAITEAIEMAEQTEKQGRKAA